MKTRLLFPHPSFKKKKPTKNKTKTKREINFYFYLPSFYSSNLWFRAFSCCCFQVEKTCLQNFPLPFQRTGQAQLHEHNKDEFPGLNTICNKVPLPEQEMQREGFSATWQIRARKLCQSKHHYWEGPAGAQMTVGRVSCPGRPQSRYRYARRAGSSSPRLELGSNCFLGQTQLLPPQQKGYPSQKHA